MNLVLLGGLEHLAMELLLLLKDVLHLRHCDAIEQGAGTVLVHFLDALPQRLLVGSVQLVQRHVGEDLLHGGIHLQLDLSYFLEPRDLLPELSHISLRKGFATESDELFVELPPFECPFCQT